MYKILQSKNFTVYLEGTSTLIEVDINGRKKELPLKEFWESDAPNMAKAHLLGVLRQCNEFQAFAILIAPLFGGETVITWGGKLVYIFFYNIPVVVEKANAYISEVFENHPHTEYVVKACDFLEVLL